eukprot:jgi/Mesen1/5648/ME000286S04860
MTMSYSMSHAVRAVCQRAIPKRSLWNTGSHRKYEPTALLRFVKLVSSSANTSSKSRATITSKWPAVRPSPRTSHDGIQAPIGFPSDTTVSRHCTASRGRADALSNQSCPSKLTVYLPFRRSFVTRPAAEPMAPVEEVDCVVIGAGVVGLAIARRLAMAGREVVLLEANAQIGMGTSSRNSEVIHASIYYPPGSLKARLCTEGRRALYGFCDDHGVPYSKLGKLIVATTERQVAELSRLQEMGRANGAHDLRMVDAAEALEMEPNLRCVRALHSPSTGVLDSHSLMLSLVGDAEAHGAALALNSSVVNGQILPGSIQINVCDTPPSGKEAGPQPRVPPPAGTPAGPGEENQPRESATTAGDLGSSGGRRDSCGEAEDLSRGQSEGQRQGQILGQSVDYPLTMSLRAKVVINAAGLDAIPVARRLVGLPPESIPERHLARGCYFSLSGAGRPPFKRLIYPVPEEGGLGVHVTLDLSGQIKFGPDVEWLPEPAPCGLTYAYDYGVDPSRAQKFYPAIRKYYPALPNGSLQPAYAGIRPKISPPGQPSADFGETVHGVQGLVNLYGIESPGLTASLALADHVCAMVGAMSWSGCKL